MEEYMNEIIRFWEEFLRATNRDSTITFEEAFHFEITETGANELLDLVLQGRKKATASSLAAFRLEGVKVPEVGDFNILTDWHGTPKCVTRVTKVTILPYQDMTFDICRREGEDECLQTWQNNHQKFFQAEGKALGYIFEANMPVVFEDFEVVFKKN